MEILVGILAIFLILAILEIAIPLLGVASFVVSIVLAAIAAFRGIIYGLNGSFEYQHFHSNEKGSEPARKSWFFGPNFRAIPSIFQSCFRVILAQTSYIKELLSGWFEDGELIIKGLVLVCGFEIAIIHWGVAFILSATWMGIFTVLFLIAMLIYYVIFAIFWAVDRLFLLFRGYKNDCPNCKKRSLIPEYTCPSCGAVHKKLAPNTYGVFYHTCRCGAMLGSTHFSGKSYLNPVCPRCHEPMKTGATRPITFQLIGGTASGKTVYLAALFHELHRHYGSTHANYYSDPACAEGMNELEKAFQGKYMRSTAGRDALFYADIVEPKHYPVPVKFEVVDIPGEMFSGQTALKEGDTRLEQYKYCNGFLFLLDPFAEGDLKAAQSTDKSTEYSPASPEEVLTSFDNYLIAQGFAKTGKMVDTPLSVIVTKADTKEVRKRLTFEAIDEEWETNRKAYASYDACRDQLIKEFLASVSQASLVSNIEARFKNVHFYLASPMGHSPNDKAYAPWGVLAPVRWPLTIKDKKYVSCALLKEDKHGN
ncbi:MAG: hypothetical protein SPG64_04585 [Candidatus Enteromonas sp.]|nr:hypothetical protein [Candidatus Enteromonas sp.]